MYEKCKFCIYENDCTEDFCLRVKHCGSFVAKSCRSCVNFSLDNSLEDDLGTCQINGEDEDICCPAILSSDCFCSGGGEPKED